MGSETISWTVEEDPLVLVAFSGRVHSLRLQAGGDTVARQDLLIEHSAYPANLAKTRERFAFLARAANAHAVMLDSLRKIEGETHHEDGRTFEAINGWALVGIESAVTP